MTFRLSLNIAVSVLIFSFCNQLSAQQIDSEPSGRLLLQGGTIIDVRTGDLRSNTVIVIEGDRIAAISNEPVSPSINDRSLNLTGQFIIPGLIDAHVHYEEFASELLLNHGVTTVLDLGNDYEWIKATAEGIRAGWFPGPRLYYSTPHFDAPPPAGHPWLEGRFHKHFIEDVNEAEAATKKYISQGVSAIKIYQGLDDDVTEVVVSIANDANIPVMGHFRDAEVAASMVGAGIEHLGPLAVMAQDPELVRQVRELSSRRPGSIGLGSVASVDWDKMETVIDMLVEKDAYLNATLLVGSKQIPHVRTELGFLYEDFDLLINNWRLRYIPLQFRLHLLMEYMQQGVWHWDDLNEEEQRWAVQQFENAQRITKMYSDRGGKLYAGPDCAAGCTFGLGLHQEMELLVDSGISPLKALQSATLHTAEVMRMEDKIGTVEENKLADLVVLRANPLENIRNTRAISHVILGGRVLDGEYHPEFNALLEKPEPETSGHFFPSPVITWISPEALTTESSPARLSLRGSGFIPYSLINFGGNNLETRYLGSTHIEVDIPPSLLQRGTYDVTVENPDFAYGRATTDLFHLGVLPRISNVHKIIVKPPGIPISPHPNEARHR